MRILLDAELARRVVGENGKPGTYSRPTKPRAQGSKELRQTLEAALDASLPPHQPPANGRPIDLHVAGHLFERIQRVHKEGWSHMRIEDYVTGLFSAVADPDAARAAAPLRLEDARIAAEAQTARRAELALQREIDRAKNELLVEQRKIREAEDARRREKERLLRRVKLIGHVAAAQGVLSGRKSRRKLAVGRGKATRWYDLCAEGDLAEQLDSFVTGELISVEGDPWGPREVRLTAVGPADVIRHRLQGPEGPGIDVNAGLNPGFTHVDVPRAGVTCKSIGIKYAPAIIRWDYIRGRTFPIVSGIVVATDDAGQLIAALDQRRAKKAQKTAAEAQRVNREL